nr:hypothetical protein [Tanacetum cinerariifolium]
MKWVIEDSTRNLVGQGPDGMMHSRFFKKMPSSGRMFKEIASGLFGIASGFKKDCIRCRRDHGGDIVPQESGCSYVLVSTNVTETDDMRLFDVDVQGEQDLRYLFFLQSKAITRSRVFIDAAGYRFYFTKSAFNREDAEKLQVHTVAEAGDMNSLGKMVDGSSLEGDAIRSRSVERSSGSVAPDLGRWDSETRTPFHNFRSLCTLLHYCTNSISRCILSSKWCPSSCTPESTSIGRGLVNHPTHYICNTDNGIVEACLNMNKSFWYSTYILA